MSRTRWTAAEIEQLVTRYDSEGYYPLVQTLGRSVDAVTCQAYKLGLRSSTRHQRHALTLAQNSTSVNVHFFDAVSPTVAFVLGYIWARGHIKTKPHLALILSCPHSAAASLIAVQRLLGSTHALGRRRNRTVVQVPSWLLVKSLLTRFGSPPNRSNPDPPLPHLADEFLPKFAQGFLLGGGSLAKSEIRWTGTPRMIDELQEKIRAATGVPEPRIEGRKGFHTITWTDPAHLQVVKRWLTLVGHKGSSEVPPSLK